MDRYACITPRDELYNYSLILPFEEGFTPIPSTIWMQNNWRLSLALSFVYAVSIYVGQKIMSRRSPFELDNLLTIWNTILALFSIMGAWRMSPEFFYVLNTHGFQYSVCTGGYEHITTSGFWTELFVFSKALELIDTLFIVLRKRSVIFLHWYHHITVLVYTWHAYKDHTAAGRWFIWMNYHVHAFMYTYYALRSCGWRFPKWIAMSITFSQLAQMIVGCLVAVQTYRTKSSGEFCQQTYENLYFSFSIYFSYFLLFARFFYDVYLKKGNRYQQHEKKFHLEKEKQGKVQNGHATLAEAATATARAGCEVQNGYVSMAVSKGDEKKVR